MHTRTCTHTHIPSMKEECYVESIHLVRLVEPAEGKESTDVIQTIHLQQEPKLNPTPEPSTCRPGIPQFLLRQPLTWEHKKASCWKRPFRKSHCSLVVMMQLAWMPWQHGRLVISQVRCGAEALAFKSALHIGQVRTSLRTHRVSLSRDAPGAGSIQVLERGNRFKVR